MRTTESSGIYSFDTLEAQEADWAGPGTFADELRGSRSLPERDEWQRLCRAHKDRSGPAAQAALDAIESTLARRRAGESLPTRDEYTEENRLAPTDELGAAWAAYKHAVGVAALDAASEALMRLRSFSATR